MAGDWCVMPEGLQLAGQKLDRSDFAVWSYLIRGDVPHSDHTVVRVGARDEISAGDEICVIEPVKMEHSIPSNLAERWAKFWLVRISR